MKRLGELVTIIKGNKAPVVFLKPTDKAIRYLQIEDLRPGSSIKYAINKDGTIARSTDILIAWDGANAGTVGFGLEGYIGSTLAILRPTSKEIITPFIGYFLKFKYSEIKKNTTGATIPHVSRDHLTNLIIPLPPLNEQRRIVEVLEKVDRIRRLRRHARQLSDGYLESVFLGMFGDPATNPQGWKTELLKVLCISPNGIKAGPFGSSLKKEIYTKSGYRIYGQEQVISGDFTIGDYYISKELFNKQFSTYEVKPNDLLISLVGTFGKTIVVPKGIKPGIINPRLVKISPNPNLLDSVFLQHLLRFPTIQKQLVHLSHGGTMGIINAGQLKEFKMICPPIDKQENFSEIVSQFECFQSRQIESERQAEQLFQSLLHQAFTE